MPTYVKELNIDIHQWIIHENGSLSIEEHELDLSEVLTILNLKILVWVQDFSCFLTNNVHVTRWRLGGQRSENN